MLLTKVVALETFTNTNFNIKNPRPQLLLFSWRYVTLLRLKRDKIPKSKLLVRFSFSERESIRNGRFIKKTVTKK